MTRKNVQELLAQLRQVIINEREHAKQLNIKAMQNDMAQKTAIINALDAIEQLHPEDEQLAREIREENRRNAYLFRATLQWIRETMEFFGKKTVPTTYGHTGATKNSTINGRLLSGRI
ncbi:MAG: flagellar protein FlgN [Desulfobulbus propionicus]|nr:MAG: flagellar protein FlgN [Desulfobulbus propionicus]PIE66367.1 MAG: flagellar protein FlgN [Desulfobacterales bacterium]